ncbi:MAG: transposase [Colwellia sp.]|nr:transposase [Colwellia sp.]
MSWNDLRKGRFSEPQREYFITFVCNNRISLFTQHEFSHAFCSTILFNEKQYDCKWLTWVLMPDHFHGLLQLGKSYNLSQVIKHLKGASARSINVKNGTSIQVWQPGYFDRALRQTEDRKQIARYIVANPLRKNIIDNISQYPYWNSVYL